MSEFYTKRIRELLQTIEVFKARLRCEAITGAGKACGYHPWTTRDGRPVCFVHKQAKEVRFR